MGRIFEARIWKEGRWYVAEAVDVGVASQGTSEEQALSNLREALELYFEPDFATYAETQALLERPEKDGPETSPRTCHVEVEIAAS